MSAPHGPGNRESSLKLALTFCLIDLALMGSVAFTSNSVTILGDVLKEATDTLSVLAAFLTVRAVRRSANHRYAYGVGKLENLVSIGIGGMMVLAALYVTAHSAQHLQKPIKPEGTLPGVVLFGIYAAVSYGIFFLGKFGATPGKMACKIKVVRPDGSPLLLQVATQPTQAARQLDELMRRDMAALQLRTDFRPATWPEQYKAARAGKLMMWSLSGRAGAPDGIQGLLRYDGAAAGGLNLSRFDLSEMNRLIARLQELPDGAERNAVFHQTKLLAAAWMPYKLRIHPVQAVLTQPWVKGFRQPLFRANWFEYVDVER